MKKTSLYLILLLFFVSIGAIIYWFLENFERVTETKYVGYQGEARYNPLLAAQRLLEQSGTVAQTAYSFSRVSSQLTPQDTLVLLIYDDSYLTLHQHQQLLNWVKSGGHLIISSLVTSDSEAEDNFLFNQVGVSIQENELEYEDVEQASTTDFTWNHYSLKIAFSPETVLKTRKLPSLAASSEYGIHLLVYKLGQGYLSVLSDLQFIYNDQIGEHDHAPFLWYLVHYQRQVAKTWLLLLRNADIPSLTMLLWQHAQPFVVSSFVLLIFWLWSISRRFGTLLPSPPRTRRRLLEHIEASGHFLWRYQQSHLLLATVRQAVLKRLEQVHPSWVTLSRAELCQQLAQLGKLSPQQVDTALYQVQFETEALFTQAVQTLTIIKEKL
ncbi:MAG: hypothetical protein BWK79_03735 [Beggiatoa sp. IS2]|nr:MAG: hypothetical protein BWK79_03735 [Beggiatoa sp. IS2]